MRLLGRGNGESYRPGGDAGAYGPDPSVRHLAFCPHCHEEQLGARALADVERLAGYLAEDDGRVWLVRGCARHGKIVTLYDEVPEILAYLEEWTAPTTRSTPPTRRKTSTLYRRATCKRIGRAADIAHVHSP